MSLWSFLFGCVVVIAIWLAYLATRVLSLHFSMYELTIRLFVARFGVPAASEFRTTSTESEASAEGNEAGSDAATSKEESSSEGLKPVSPKARDLDDKVGDFYIVRDPIGSRIGANRYVLYREYDERFGWLGRVASVTGRNQARRLAQRLSETSTENA